MKKAIIYSIISILIVIVFIAVTDLTTKFKVEESDLEITRTRVRILNSLVNDMENNYFDKMIYTSAKNSLIGLSKYYSEDYDRLTRPLDVCLLDVIYDGNLTDIYGINHNLKNYIAPKYTIYGMKKELEILLAKLGMKVNRLDISIIPGSLEQTDPFHFKLDAEIDYYFADMEEKVNWEGTEIRTVEFSAYGVYAFDMPSGRAHIGKISSKWKIDEANTRATEPSLYKKLSSRFPTWSPTDLGMGICSPLFDCISDGS